MGLIKDELEELGFKVTGKSCKDTSIRNVLKRFKENYEGANITVDSQISSTSENPVQNKVIKQALDGKATYDGFKTFLNQSLQKGNETDLALPNGSLDFGVNSRITVSDTLWNYFYRKSPIGYTFLLNLSSVNLGTVMAHINCNAIIIGEGFSVSTATYENVKILDLALESNFDRVQKGVHHRLGLRLWQNSPNIIEVYEKGSHQLLLTTDVNGQVIEGVTGPVSSGAVYDYVKEIRPNSVYKMVTNISQFQELLMTYSNDYMHGLGKVFYWKLGDATPMVFECFMSASITVVEDAEPIFNPIIKYIDSQGVVQTIDPTTLNESNYLEYTGYHYGPLPVEESSGDDSGGGSVK